MLKIAQRPAIWPRVRSARHWFKAFRRTRPFWGGLWLILGGWMVLRLSMVSFQVVMTAGMAGFGGWLTGGGMICCGLIALAAPSQRYVAGLIGLLLAVASLLISNLGGLLVGMLAGILGSSMTLSWGPRRSIAIRPLIAKLFADNRRVYVHPGIPTEAGSGAIVESTDADRSKSEPTTALQESVG